jgi:hypothetical protein
MNLLRKKKIVFLGMMTRYPVAGAVWGTLHYLLGFQRLGYDVYYVEAHGGAPLMLMTNGHGDGSAEATAFLADVLRRIDLGDRWAYHARHSDGRCYGMSHTQLKQLYTTADLLINYHGGTDPLPEHSATGRLVFLETDPVALEVALQDHPEEVSRFLAPHCAFFTWGLNYGNSDCKVPLPDRFHFCPSPPVVVPELWRCGVQPPGPLFTTVGRWRQFGREVVYKGETYHWSKHYEFEKVIDLPLRTSQQFELAMSSRDFEEDDRRLLENNGWKVREALSFSTNLDAYRRYVVGSRGEFTVAKDQNVRLRSGWFSERSAQYLAAGRPVITQETGFSNVLPTGRGLFAFSSMEEILQAVDAVNADYERHSRAAAEIARGHFGYDVVLPRLLSEVGL